MQKYTKVRVAAVLYIAVALLLLLTSISLGWLEAEGQEVRGPIPWAWRNRVYPCGLVRGLPVIADLVDTVPCQVWNLAPLNLVALFTARWLIVDLWRPSRS